MCAGPFLGGSNRGLLRRMAVFRKAADFLNFKFLFQHIVFFTHFQYLTLKLKFVTIIVIWWSRVHGLLITVI